MSKYVINQLMFLADCNKEYVKCLCNELAETLGEILPTEIWFGAYTFKIDNFETPAYDIYANKNKIGKIIFERVNK